jgi:hypothetical protein
MNKAILIKLYNEATESSNDLMDMGRKELAQELLTECNSFLQAYYPDYGDEHIAIIDDLEEVVFRTDEEGSHARMLCSKLGYSHCFDWLVKEVAKAYSLASENKLKQERQGHLKIDTRHDEHLVVNGDTVDLILPDGSVGSFRHNGEALIVSLYQTRLVDDNWDDVWEGKLYEFEIPQEIPSVTDEAVEKAMEFFNPKCEK